jgi:hypothetical protein
MWPAAQEVATKSLDEQKHSTQRRKAIEGPGDEGTSSLRGFAP